MPTTKISEREEKERTKEQKNKRERKERKTRRTKERVLEKEKQSVCERDSAFDLEDFYIEMSNIEFMDNGIGK